MSATYPLVLTRDSLDEAGACDDGLDAFDGLTTDGVLTIPDVAAHVAILVSPLGQWEAWAVSKGILPPIVVETGDLGHAIAGYKGHVTAGRHGTGTAGDFGHATAGYKGHVTAGRHGTGTAGDLGHATAGYKGRAIVGDCGHAKAGDGGHATAGYRGTATAGNFGIATAGDFGTATAGDEGTVSAGEGGTLVLVWFEGKRRRLAVAYVGEDGILPDTPYRLDGEGRFVRAQSLQ